MTRQKDILRQSTTTWTPDASRCIKGTVVARLAIQKAQRQHEHQLPTGKHRPLPASVTAKVLKVYESPVSHCPRAQTAIILYLYAAVDSQKVIDSRKWKHYLFLSV